MREEPVTTEQPQGQPGSGGARDWATFQESQFRPFYDAVHDRIEIGNRTQVLDVGCGPGGAAVLAAARGARVAGIDISPAAIDVAAARIQEGDFRVGDMESLPWPDASFDVVTGFNSFQFASNRVTALAEARRVLRQGGKLGIVVWTPPEQSQQPRIMAAISALAPPSPADAPGPFTLSKPGVLESALKSAGFQLVDSGEIPIVVEYPDGDTACRAMLGGSGGVRAIRHSGEERVRQTILEALEAYRSETGGYRMENRFRFVIAE
jgi:SAM-dependent methyltransferase